MFRMMEIGSSNENEATKYNILIRSAEIFVLFEHFLCDIDWIMNTFVVESIPIFVIIHQELLLEQRPNKVYRKSFEVLHTTE